MNEMGKNNWQFGNMSRCWQVESKSDRIPGIKRPSVLAMLVPLADTKTNFLTVTQILGDDLLGDHHQTWHTYVTDDVIWEH